MSGKGMSAAAMPGARGGGGMAGSQRIRRHWHATQRDRGREGDESFFVKRVILLLSLWFKQKFVCDCTDNARSLPTVARHRDTFACQTLMRFALIRPWGLVSNFAQSAPRQRPLIAMKSRSFDSGAMLGALLFYVDRQMRSWRRRIFGKRGDSRGRPLVKDNASVAFGESRLLVRVDIW